MPTISYTETKDTQDMYKVNTVSYGCSNFCSANNMKIKFSANKLINTSKIDERNLIFCLYLNFYCASITSLETTYLGNLRVLILYSSKIEELITAPLVNLEYLDISETNIFELNTQTL